MTVRSGVLAALTASAMLGPAAPLAAQVRPSVEWGVHYSTLDFDRELEVWRNGWRPSFTAGASLELALGRRFTLAPGLRYVQKGNRVRLSDPSIGLTGELRRAQNYLAVPVLLQLRPSSSRRIALSLGPEAAFLISAYDITEYRYGGGPTYVEDYDDIRDAMNATDWSLEAGIEYAFPLENHEGFLRVHYSHGLGGVAEASQWVSDWSTRGIRWVTGLRW